MKKVFGGQNVEVLWRRNDYESMTCTCPRNIIKGALMWSSFVFEVLVGECKEDTL